MRVLFGALLLCVSACSYSAGLIEPIVVSDKKSSAVREIDETRCKARGKFEVIAKASDEHVLHQYTNESSAMQEIRVEVVENCIAIDYPGISYAIERDGAWTEIVFPPGSFFSTGARATVQLDPGSSFSFYTPIDSYVENESSYRLLMDVVSGGEKGCVLSQSLNLVE
jgi:hypothetical protein